MKKSALYQQLVQRYLDGTASTDEVEAFFHLLNKGKLEAYLSPDAPAPVRRLGSWKVYSAAAAVLLIIATGLVLWLRPRGKTPSPAAVNIFKNDVAPGGIKATLTLANGHTISLDSTKQGALASQEPAHVQQPSSVALNTLSTPAGGQYQVTLADGTRVWLNALSSLKYPAAFSGKERVVELTGEAYFEVADDATHPFRVNTGSLQVNVLGTHFNLNAYDDESSINTTLLEGAVKITHTDGKDMPLLLKPGQQAQTTAGGSALIGDADVDKAVAWKNGYFSFDGADIHTVMRQIARWYGVQVHYEGAPTQALFGGDIGRDLSLTQLLKGLSRTNLHFRLENKTLTVLP